MRVLVGLVALSLSVVSALVGSSSWRVASHGADNLRELRDHESVASTSVGTSWSCNDAVLSIGDPDTDIAGVLESIGYARTTGERFTRERDDSSDADFASIETDGETVVVRFTVYDKDLAVCLPNFAKPSL